MTTIVLHMGQPKTGTTSIQRFFVDNQETLLAHGILYPQTGRYSEKSNIHWPLFLSMLDSSRREHLHMSAPASSAATYLRRLQGEILAFGARKALLSDEGLFLPWKHDRVSLERIRDGLPADRILVFLVLRRQSDLMVSDYAQAVMGPRRYGGTPQQYLQQLRQGGYFDYEARLDEIADVFGMKAMRVCWFDDVRSNLLAPLQRLLDLDEVDGLREIERVNEQRPLTLVRMLRWSNKAGTTNRATHAGLTWLHNKLVPKALGALALPYGRAVLDELDETYAPMNHRISARYDMRWWAEVLDESQQDDGRGERQPEQARG